MKKYLDNYCCNRPYDDQTSLRRLETETKLDIHARIKEATMFRRLSVCFWGIIMGLIVFSASVQGSITVDEDLNIHVPCVDVNGIFYQIDLKLFAHPDDPSGLYWELGKGIDPAEDDDKCAVLGLDMSLFLPDVNVMETMYNVTLFYSPEFQYPNTIIWKFGTLSPGASAGEYAITGILVNGNDMTAGLSPDNVLQCSENDTIQFIGKGEADTSVLISVEDPLLTETIDSIEVSTDENGIFHYPEDPANVSSSDYRLPGSGIFYYYFSSGDQFVISTRDYKSAVNDIVSSITLGVTDLTSPVAPDQQVEDPGINAYMGYFQAVVSSNDVSTHDLTRVDAGKTRLDQMAFDQLIRLYESGNQKFNGYDILVYGSQGVVLKSKIAAAAGLTAASAACALLKMKTSASISQAAIGSYQASGKLSQTAAALWQGSSDPFYGFVSFLSAQALLRDFDSADFFETIFSGTGDLVSAVVQTGPDSIEYIETIWNHNGFDNIKVIIFTARPVASDPSEDPEDPPEKDYYYKGTLTVSFTNKYPEWSVSETMEVMIEDGFALIDDGTLSYSGETLVSDDSKIIRRGAWQMFPTAEIITIEDYANVVVDAHIDLIYDTTEIYVRESGQWIMVNSFSVSNQPCSQVSFPLEEALGGSGAVTGVDVESGSIVWTLFLEQMFLDPAENF